ncbi:MAG: 3-oxoacyl-ACP reductase [Rhodobacteraceae bacterium]|nr:3-oxoacyl-ACP reductase [Paracoccaceae bacterium]MBR29253.1 3-oxoacyl-ACP reductase [Paracoccaceae bacterium]
MSPAASSAAPAAEPGPAALATYPDLRGRSVLISGGATGIGEALTRAFAAQGARVAFVDLAREAGEALAAELAGQGATIRFAPVDVTDAAAYQAAIRAAAEAHGPITALLNNAANDQRHGVGEVGPDRFDSIVAVNLKHAFVAAQAAAPMMRAAGGGTIVNFGSISWMMAGAGYPVYAACKAATHGLTRSLARDLGRDRIRVNTLVPGWVMTEKQLRLWVDDAAREQIARSQCLPGPVLPWNIAQMALFLASDASAMCSAQNFIVDGGWV